MKRIHTEYVRVGPKQKLFRYMNQRARIDGLFYFEKMEASRILLVLKLVNHFNELINDPIHDLVILWSFSWIIIKRNLKWI